MPDTTLTFLLAWVLAWSLIALGAAAWDKIRARRGGRRVSERTLLGLALVGGSPGLLVGMLVLRHKTRKRGFQVRLGLVFAFQAALLLILRFA
jgi:uncharacterized membrane protein YsdA (DUF1294 family)